MAGEGITISRGAIRRTGYTFLALLVLAVLIVAVIAIANAVGGSGSLPSSVNTSEYQGVFLTNGEVYFGKLSTSGDFYELRHVYRLAAQPATRTQPAKRSLVKLISDIQGPEDVLLISRSQVLYIENLTPNGSAAKLMNRGGP